MRIPKFCLILCACTLLAGHSFAQTPYDPVLQQGIQPFQAYGGGDLDSINLATGSLNLHIPVVSFPQRGPIHLDYSVAYNSQVAVPVTVSALGHVFSRWEFSGGDTGLTNNSFPSVSLTATQLTNDGAGADSALLIEGDGTSHTLGFTNNNATQARTVDGSGFLVNSPLVPASYTIIDRDGITTTRTGCTTTETDPNGNQMTLSILNSSPPDCIGEAVITDTLGRQITGCQTNSSCVFPGPNGGTATYQIAFYGQPYGSPISSLTLPNLTSYSFQYTTLTLPTLAGKTTGSTTLLVLSSVTLPTGGTISYGYAPDATWMSCSAYAAYAPVTSRTVNANDGTGSHTWTYSYTPYTGGNSSTITTTVTDPLGNVSIHTFPNACTPYETQLQQEDSSGNILKTVKTTIESVTDSFGVGPYEALSVNPTSITTIWPNGQESSVSMTYDRDSGSGFAFGTGAFLGPGYGGTIYAPGPASYTSNPWTKTETDYGQGTPGATIRTTNTSYLAFANSNYLANNLLDLPYSVQIQDGSGSQVAFTQYGYDETAVASSGLTGSSYFNPAPPAGSYRGNNTSVQRWLNIGTAVCPNGAPQGSGYVTSRSTYFDTGMLDVATDPCGDTTTYAYASTYQGAFPTTVTNALGQNDKYEYDFNSGLKTSSTDANIQTTSYDYDSSWRLTSVGYPDGGSTTYCYKDTSSVCLDAIAVPSVYIKKVLSSTSTLKVEADVDGLGRMAKQRLLSDPGGVDYVDTSYDPLGRVQTISNPYRSTSNGLTTYSYDALGRKIAVTLPDGNTRQWCYNGIATAGQNFCQPNRTSMAGLSWVDSLDEAGHPLQHVSDALGQLRAVIEPAPTGSTLNRESDYSYDALGNLTAVVQQGQIPETPRTRSFKYDSLSRLLWSQNPETGVICYGQGNGTTAGCQSNGYDANGNLLYKTDARGITTGYTYDALNRLTSKQYSDGTVSAIYGYDGLNGEGSPVGQTVYNTVGRLSLTSNNINAGATYSYDSMGRLTQQWVYLPTYLPNTHIALAQAKYDLAGNITDLWYPDGRHIQQGWDGAAHQTTSNLIDISGTPASASYLQSGSYYPDGSPNVITLGNGVQQTITKNNRLQVQGLTVSTPLAPFNGQSFLSHSYCYVACATGGTGNNGNIWGVTDTLNAANTQGFTYDSLNRITSFSLGGAANQQYQLDSFGNMGIVGSGVTTNTFDPTTNRINNLPCASATQPYDAAGNQLCWTDQYGGVVQDVYDAESRIASMNTLGTASPFVSYLYGPDGARVEKTNANGTATEYVDFNGQPISELDQAGNWTDYIYAEGKKIARVSDAPSVIHFSGTNCSNCGYQGWAYTLPFAGVTIQAGDRISWLQKQGGAAVPRGGLTLAFNDGTFTNWVTPDSNGQIMNDLTTQGQWVSRSADLSGLAGEVVATSWINEDSNSGPGNWDEWYSDIAFMRADGTVIPIFNGQPVSYSGFGFAGVTNQTFQVQQLPDSDPLAETHFYTDDHLGTAQMEMSSGGWPIWQGQFAPFGQEIDTQLTTNHYKFTGKERDSESGLDYFGARYYGSNMGRFMSPDWSDESDPVPYADLKNPQSLNLYSYVHNNPLRVADPDGHDGEDEEGIGDQQEAAAIPVTAPFVLSIPSVAETLVGIIAAAPEVIGGAAVFGPAMAFPKDLDCACLTPAQQAAYAAKANSEGGESAGAEHTTGARESTRKKHEDGQARKKKDRGGEKGDKRRRPNRKPPIVNGKKVKGPWPPRNAVVINPPIAGDNSTVTTSQHDKLPQQPNLGGNTN